MGVVVFSHLSLLLDVPLVGLLYEATHVELGGVLHLLGHQFPLGIDLLLLFVCEIAVNLHLEPLGYSPTTSFSPWTVTSSWAYALTWMLSGWGTTSSWSRTWGSPPFGPPTLGSPPCSFTPSPALGFGYYKVAFVIFQSRCAHAQPCWLCACAGFGTWHSSLP